VGQAEAQSPIFIYRTIFAGLKTRSPRTKRPGLEQQWNGFSGN